MEYFWRQQDDIPSGMGYPLFGEIHIFSSVITILIVLILINHLLKVGSRKRMFIIKLIPVVMLFMELFKDAFLISVHRFSVAYLPLHVCSIGIFIFLLREYLPWKWAKDFFGELAYVLIMPGSIAALLFPDWTIYYPVLNFMNLYSFAWHGALILYPLLLRRTGLVKPSIKHIYQPILFLLVTTPLIYAFDQHFNCNFFFVNWPVPGSPLSYFASLLGNPGYLIGYAWLVLIILIIVYVIDLLIKTILKDERII
ncbi:YwaF family protein [Butyrivibrio fibrisolvens]|uniref:YwaF family protein n=1 Tax=Butyrivibrio fibrisolvens TaxID=831 RepID=UPI0020C17752|nr:YwaF family protein [Butyrivibrio fibrisolvens]